MSLFLPFADQSRGPFWEWWLVDAKDMSQIGVLDAHNKTLQRQLNSAEKATCWVHLLDDLAAEIDCLSTGIRCDRDGETVWSGRVFQTTESSQGQVGQEEGQDQLQVTAMGWFQNLNMRDVHTGAEFSAMLAGPNGVAWETQNGTYSSLGIDTAIQLAYDVIEFPATSDAAIIFDLLARANIDSPTRIAPGNVYGTPFGRNLTLQRFQNVGQQITQLCNVENGVDFLVDPLTRKMSLYGPGASSDPVHIPNGRGTNRSGAIFTYPGNCTAFQRSRDGTITANRVEASGQYGVGRADDVTSQSELDLYEINDQLSEVVDPNILAAYANAEVTVRSRPWTVVTFTPRGVTSNDESRAPGVPRPFEDFDLGDVVYCTVNRGATQIGSSDSPQAVRVFGYSLAVDDSGVEKLTSLQSTYQALGGGAA